MKAISLIFLIICNLLLTPSLSFAQQKHTLSGYIKDAETGESLIGANIYVHELKEGASANQYGFYSITLPEGAYTVEFSYLGYETQQIKVTLNEDKRMNISLGYKALETQEVIIIGEKQDKNVESTDMGMIELPIEDIKTLPVLFGETDILKTLQLLPGVQSAGEGNAGFYVRGGGPDQNLIILDEAPLYNVGHLFGFFSVFNADALKSTTLIKGGMPANYGGRLSSVVDITMKDGNNKKFMAKGGIGTISSRLTVEGPIIKDKSSFMISGRRTYFDLLMRPLLKGSDYEGNKYYFYDLNAKANYKFSDKDRLYLSGYFGRDVFSFTGSTGFFSIHMPWGNTTTTLRWNHLFSKKIFMNATAIYTNYNFETDVTFDEWRIDFFSGIKDYSLKLDFDYYPNVLHSIKFGAIYTYHTFTPSTASAKLGDTLELRTDEVMEKYAHEAAVYVLDEFDVTENLKINAGLRLSLFQQVGPYKAVTLDDDDKVTDSTLYNPLQPVKTFWGPEPRLSMRYKLGKKSSVKASFTMNNQYVHLVSNSGTTLPTDIWVPSSLLVEPQKATQYAIGYFRNFRDNMFETSLELYYKNMRNQVEFESGYTPEIDKEIEQDFTFGRGWSYGAEVFIKKRRGKLNGWIGYTLSWTMREFAELNDPKGEPFPAKYDRRHDLSVVLMYNISKRVNVSGTFVYGTGSAFTLPTGMYIIGESLAFDYESLNNSRLAPYHRLDLSLTLKGKEDAKFRSFWTFAVYNAYNRSNPFFIYYEWDAPILSGNADIKPKQVSLFPMIPSITWNFELDSKKLFVREAGIGQL